MSSKVKEWIAVSVVIVVVGFTLTATGIVLATPRGTGCAVVEESE